MEAADVGKSEGSDPTASDRRSGVSSTVVLSAKERVRAALRFEETDIVPHDWEFVAGLLGPLREHFGLSDDQPDDALYRLIGNHVFRFAVGGQARERSESIVIDDFGVAWRRGGEQQRIGGWGGIERHALVEADLRGYQFPSANRPELFVGVNELVSTHADQFVIAEVPGMLEEGWAIRGFEPLLLDLYENPEFVGKLFDGILEYDLGLVEQFSHFAIDGIWCGDDWAQQQGLFMAPAVWRRVWKPRLRELYGAIRAKGLAVVVHCCGDCFELIPDLIELGASMLNPVQPESLDVARVKQEFGRDIALYGGLGVQRIVPSGTPEQVREWCIECLTTLGRGGGFVFGSGSSMTADTPVANALVCLEVARSQERAAGRG